MATNYRSYAVNLEHYITGKLCLNAHELTPLVFSARQIEEHPLMALVCAAAFLSQHSSLDDLMRIDELYKRYAFYSTAHLDELFLYDKSGKDSRGLEVSETVYTEMVRDFKELLDALSSR